MVIYECTLYLIRQRNNHDDDDDNDGLNAFVFRQMEIFMMGINKFRLKTFAGIILYM